MFKERKSEYSDVLELIDNLREEDVRELELLNTNPETALINSFFHSEYCFTVLYKDKPIAIFGAGRKVFNNTGDKIASIWFLGSKDIERHKIEFLRKSKKYLKFFQSKFDILENYVDKRNIKYIKWLKWLGFKFDKTINVSGGSLEHFYLKKENKFESI